MIAERLAFIITHAILGALLRILLVLSRGLAGTVRECGDKGHNREHRGEAGRGGESERGREGPLTVHGSSRKCFSSTPRSHHSVTLPRFAFTDTCTT